MKTIERLILLFLFVGVFPALAKTVSIEKIQIMVVVNTGVKPNKWVNLLPKGSRVFLHRHPFYLIRLTKPISDKEIQLLRSSPYIKRVLKDRIVKAADAGSGGDQCTPRSTAQETIAQIADAAEGECALAAKCLCSGSRACDPQAARALLSAQMAMAGDLMATELERIGLDSNNTKIAVLDTGYASSLNGLMSTEPVLERDYSGGNGPDNNWHGSAVASVIGGKDGIGLAPTARIGIYKVDVAGENQSTEATIELAAMHACDSGHKIINLSFSGVDSDRTNRDLVTALAQKGCIVLKSAGNEPAQGVTRSYLEDSWLRIGGVNPDTNDPQGLNLGELNAPGVAVSALNPTISPTCEGKPISMVDGTSVAAPLAAAVLFNVRGILAKDPEFSALPGADQVTLLIRILRASVRGGIINGLRAVLIAEQWVKSTGEYKPLSQGDIDRLLINHPPEQCSRPGPPTNLSELICKDRKAALNEMRFRLAACEPPKPPGVAEMAMELARLNEREIALNMTHFIDNLDQIPAFTAQIRETARLAAEEAAANAQIEFDIQSFEEQLGYVRLLQNQVVPEGTIADIVSRLNQMEGDLVARREQHQAERDDLEGTFDFLWQGEIELADLQLEIDDKRIACTRMWSNAFSNAQEIRTTRELYLLLGRTHNSDRSCRQLMSPVPEENRYLAGLAEGAMNGHSYDQFQQLVRNKIVDLEDTIRSLREYLNSR